MKNRSAIGCQKKVNAMKSLETLNTVILQDWHNYIKDNSSTFESNTVTKTQNHSLPATPTD